MTEIQPWIKVIHDLMDEVEDGLFETDRYWTQHDLRDRLNLKYGRQYQLKHIGAATRAMGILPARHGFHSGDLIDAILCEETLEAIEQGQDLERRAAAAIEAATAKKAAANQAAAARSKESRRSRPLFPV